MKRTLVDVSSGEDPAYAFSEIFNGFVTCARKKSFLNFVRLKLYHDQ